MWKLSKGISEVHTACSVTRTKDKLLGKIENKDALKKEEEEEGEEEEEEEGEEEDVEHGWYEVTLHLVQLIL